MSIIGGSLVGTITTRLPPGGSVIGSVAYNGPAAYAAPGGSLAEPRAVPSSFVSTDTTAMSPAVSCHKALGTPRTIEVVVPSKANLPTPESIAKQKEGYAKALEEQLKHGVELLGKAHKQKMEQLHSCANQSKHQYNLMLDQQVKQHEMLLSQQYNQQLMMLQQAAQQQRAELEQQAAALVLEWQQRETQEEFEKEQRAIQQRYAQVQQELVREMQKVGIAQAPLPLVTPSSTIVVGGSARLPVGGGSSMSSSAAIPVITSSSSSHRLVIGSGSRCVSLGGSASLPVGRAVPVCRTVTPIAKYDVPGLSTAQTTASSIGSARLHYVAPSVGSVGSLSLPPGSASPSYAPVMYVPPSQCGVSLSANATGLVQSAGMYADDESKECPSR